MVQKMNMFSAASPARGGQVETLNPVPNAHPKGRASGRQSPQEGGSSRRSAVPKPERKITMLKYTILFAVVAGLVFALAPAAQAATTNGTFNSISFTGNTLDSVTVDGNTYLTGNLNGVTLTTAVSSFQVPAGAVAPLLPSDEAGVRRLASDGNLITNFRIWGGSDHDFELDSVVPTSVGTDFVVILGNYKANFGMKYSALDPDGNEIVATQANLSEVNTTYNISGGLDQYHVDSVGPLVLSLDSPPSPTYADPWNPTLFYAVAINFDPADVPQLGGIRCSDGGADSFLPAEIYGIVPEPATLALLAFGACLPLLRRRRR